MTDSERVPEIILRNGRKIPQLGFGTLNTQPDRDTSPANTQLTATIVHQALDVGYRHIDTAQSYGTETGVGRAIAESGIARETLFITSKLSNTNHAPDDVRRSFDLTLQNLGLDYLDLFLIHWPLPMLYGGDFVSTWSAVTELVSDGRLRSAGVSNFQPSHLERIIAETGEVPVVDQVELHPYFTNDVACAATAGFGIAVEAHSPLGHNGSPLADGTIASIASVKGKSIAQVILRWHIQHGRIVIPKSVRQDRMVENFEIFDFDLSATEVASIDALSKGELGRVGPNPDTYDGIWPLPPSQPTI
jgi:2,5-diketo-D-gluconate reductase A